MTCWPFAALSDSAGISVYLLIVFAWSRRHVLLRCWNCVECRCDLWLQVLPPAARGCFGTAFFRRSSAVLKIDVNAFWNEGNRGLQNMFKIWSEHVALSYLWILRLELWLENFAPREARTQLCCLEMFLLFMGVSEVLIAHGGRTRPSWGLPGRAWKGDGRATCGKWSTNVNKCQQIS